MLLALMTHWPTLACAQGSAQSSRQASEADQQRDEAVAHFERGVELYEERSLDAALVEMERAYELFPTYKLLFNLAQLQAERHEYVAALELYERYLIRGADEIEDDRRRGVEQEVSRLSGRVGTLWVASNRTGAELFIDDVSAGQLPLSEPIRVDSGIHDVRLELAGHQTVHEQVRIAGGDKLRLELSLLIETSPLPPIAPSPYARAHDDEANEADYTPFWLGAAATGALGITAVTFAVLASSANGDLDRELRSLPVDRTALEDARGRTRSAAALTDGFTGATLVAAGIALYLLIQPPTNERDARTADVRLTPLGVAGAF